MSLTLGMFYFTNKEVGAGIELEKLNYKYSCVASTTFNIAFDPPASFVIDGVLITEGQRVLVRAQTNEYENGIYIRQGSKFVRSTDCDTWEEMIMALVFVESGITLKGTSWVLYVERGGTLEIDPISVLRFPFIKTVNGISLHGMGNVTISGSGGGLPIEDFIFNEIISCDGSSIIFDTVNDYEPLTLRLFLNGMRLLLGVDYEETDDNTFTLLFSAPSIGEYIVADYIRKQII